MSEGLPKQVQEARAAADAIKARFASDTSKEAVTETKDTTETPEPVAQEVTPQKQPEPVATTENFEAKFHTLKGKYDAEVPRMADYIRQLEDKIRHLESAKASDPGAPPPPKADPVSDVNRDALIEYDEEFGKVFDLVQQQRAELATLKAALDQVQGNVSQVHQTQAQTALERYNSELARLVPDHKALDKDPAFNAWLNEPDGFSDNTRRDHGIAAVNAFDHVKVARIYNEYKSTLQAATPPPPPVPKSVDPSTHSTSPDDIAQQQQTRQQGPTFTSVEMREFHAKRARKDYPFTFRGVTYRNMEETRQIATEIMQAGIEGRII